MSLALKGKGFARLGRREIYVTHGSCIIWEISMSLLEGWVVCARKAHFEQYDTLVFEGNELHLKKQNNRITHSHAAHRTT